MTYIEGKITLDDGQEIQFDCSTENAWNQWGNSTENKGRTVDLVEKIQQALSEYSLEATS